MRLFSGICVGWITRLYLVTLVFSILACDKQQNELIADRINLEDSGRINRIFLVNDSEAYVMGGERWERGFLYRSTDGGESWDIVEEVRDTSDFWLTDMTAISESERVCVGYGGQVFYSDDRGNHWSFLRSLEYEAFESVAPNGDGSYLLGGGTLFFRGDISYSQPDQWWNLQRDTFPIKINSIYTAPTGESVIGGYGGVYVQSSADNVWQRTRMSGDIFTDIHFPTEEVGFVCGFNGSIWRINKDVSDPVRLVSTSSVLGKVRSWYDLHFFDEFHGAVVGINGNIWWTHNGGKHWKEGTLNAPGALFSIHMISNHQAFVGGQSGFFAKVTLP